MMAFTAVVVHVGRELLTSLKACRIVPFDNVIVKDLNLAICYCGKSHNTNCDQCWSV